MRTLTAALACALLATACGGAGDSSTPDAGGPPTPLVNLTATPSEVASGQPTNLVWSAAEASTCTASGGWTGNKPVSGSESSSALGAPTDFTLTCAGTGGSVARTVSVKVSQPVAAPKVTLSANPTSVGSGQASTLTWSSTDASSCVASGGWSGNQALSASASTGPLVAASSFTLTCTGTGGTTSQTVNIAVAAIAAPTVTLTATPASVIAGNGSTLAWSTTNAVSCVAVGGWSGTKAVNGSEATGPLNATRDFTLTCTGGGGDASQTVTVAVGIPPAPPSVSLTANPGSVATGAASMLSWNSANATSCTASGGWSGAKATSGSQSTGNLTSTASYTLTCSGAGGSASQTVPVVVTPPAPTVSLTANPASVNSGQSSTLAWSSINATSCTASGGWTGTKATIGTQSSGALTAGTTFTLTCSGSGGTRSQSVTVSVGSVPAATVTLTAAPLSIGSGESSTLTWSTTNATSCTASGGWTGAKATSGSQSTGALNATTAFALSCSGTGGSGTASATVTVTQPPPTVTFTANPGTVGSGGSSTLTWSTTNATSCTASDGWAGAKATSGSQSTGALAVTTSFTINCTGPGGSAGKSVTVTVTPPAPAVTLSANPTSVTTGQFSTLTWSATNAADCAASGAWTGAKATSGSESTGVLNSTSDFTLTCTGPGGSGSRTVTVTVTPPAPTVTISAAPASIANGASSTLTWSSTNATSCTASGGWSGAKATSGSQSTGALSATATFTLTCTGLGGSGSQSATVTVNPPAPTVTISAAPASIANGASSTLTWSSTNATSCTASGGWSGAKATSGSQSTGALSATATFTLTCTGLGGSGSQSATVTVNAPAPTVTLTANPLTVSSGGSSTLTWSSTNATSCTASGGWTGAKATSGSQSTGSLSATTSFTLTCSGPGGTASDTMTVTVGASAGAAFPLHTEAGKRYLIDANGQPFFVHGDTPWSLIVQLTREQTDQYLEDRRLKGFNTILVNLIEHKFATNPPSNAYGNGPFTVPGDFSTPNEAYFAHAEYVISKAAEKGILVMLTPSYMGFGGGDEGWYQEMIAAGATKLRAYGQYVANRFAAYDNILWVHGGDFGPAEKLLARAVVDGIRSVDAGVLHTFHCNRGCSALLYWGTSEPWLTVNNIYTGNDNVVSNAFAEYARSTMPFFLIEAGYEGEGSNNEAVIRTQAYQTVLSGGGGHLMGNKPIWPFAAGWQTALNSPGATSLAKLKALFDSLPWWTLQPDTGNTFLTAGAGSGGSRAVAAKAAAFALLYTPSVRALTVNLGQLTGPTVRARWYDPTNGTYTTVPGSPFTAASGSQTFTPTGNNARGFGDWVLVLESI